jgi:hypothetical protein
MEYLGSGLSGVIDANTLNGMPSSVDDSTNTIVVRDSYGDITVRNINGNVSGSSSSSDKVSKKVTGTSVADLVSGEMADNDYFRIRVGGTATNAGYVEFATADDGTESIYMRQYTGVFATVLRTATILDSSGNTSFPGIVTSSKFISTVAQGTAPFTVTSTTKVTNLNADLLDDMNTASGNTPSTIVNRDSSGNFSAGTISAALSGNATTATTLQTTRTVNGVPFNGSANITVEPYIEDDESTNAEKFLVFTDNSTAGHKRLNEDSSLTYNPATGDLNLTGTLSAAAKSFLIPHPTKENMKLKHGSLEGPENGVYIRGQVKGTNTIKLPDYWSGLVDMDSITVQLTPIGKFQKLYVKKIAENKITIANADLFARETSCFYTVFAERKDINKLEVEIPITGGR